ncbi:MAG: TolC family protein [Burkholderiaceae bacterium]
MSAALAGMPRTPPGHRTRRLRTQRLLAACAAAFALAGCASTDWPRAIDQTNETAARFTDGRLALILSDEQRADAAREAAALLQQPLGRDEAVRLALINSPALQALLAGAWAEGAAAAQSGRLPNPVFAFERLRTGDELELGRLLSFGLLDLLLLPQRHGIAQHRIEASRLRLTADVVDRVTQVRQAWVRAVADEQTLGYARQVYDSAEASADLARRMQAAGNFNRLDRARQQAFYADAAIRLAVAQQAAIGSRETLVRLLGLDDAQADRLRLPARLPDLPPVPLGAAEAARTAGTVRLDLRMAQSAFDAAARAQGLTGISSLIDIELGVRRDTIFDEGSGTRHSGRGIELELRLPLFDWGDAQRAALNAQTLAAGQRLQAVARAAGSHLRERYTAYRSAHDLVRHYRDEVLPLRQAIADEHLLRYNAMLTGVFELLADSREQIASVMAAIAAERQFWLAEAGLQAALIGRPLSGTADADATAAPSGSAAAAGAGASAAH